MHSHAIKMTLAGALLTVISAFAVADPPCCAGHAGGDHKHNDKQPQNPEALLERLEHQAGDLNAFTADVLYVHYDDLLARRETRTGHIIYKVDDVTKQKSFAVLFNRLIVGQRAQDQQKHYIFADRWLVEVDHENKQFIKREVVEPGRQLDPLKLGEGPIPLPIGQPKDEVLARFQVSLIDRPKDGPLSRLQNVDGIRLVPKEGTSEAEEFEQVDLYYDRDTCLPLGIIATERNGNTKTVRLDNVAHNPELNEEQLAKLSVEEPDPAEWAIDVERLRGAR